MPGTDSNLPLQVVFLRLGIWATMIGEESGAPDFFNGQWLLFLTRGFLPRM